MILPGIYASQISGHLTPPYSVPTNYYSIQTATVDSGGSGGTVTFSSIPSGYTHLQVRGIIQSNRGSYAIDNTMVRFNSDTGNNYSRHNLDASASSSTSPEAYGTGGSSFMGPIPTVTGVASNVFSGFVMDILDYTNVNKNKTIRILGGYDVNGTTGTGSFGGSVGIYSGAWYNSSTAVNSISFSVVDGTAFNQYSTFELFGVK